MFYSKAAFAVNRSKLVYATILYGTLAEIYYPTELLTIRSDYDSIRYNPDPEFKNKIFITSVFKQRYSNNSAFPFIPIDEENVFYSIDRFPIGSLIVLKIDRKILNYQIADATDFTDEEIVYFTKYQLRPYTQYNKTVNFDELNDSENRDYESELVTDLSSDVDSDLKFEVAPTLGALDPKLNRPRVIKRIKEA